MNMTTAFTTDGIAVSKGDVYRRGTDSYRNGFRATVELVVTVKGFTDGYRDPWTGKVHSVGVEFTIYDTESLVTSHATLGLDTFVGSWVA